jgi:hypothetical protein
LALPRMRADRSAFRTARHRAKNVAVHEFLAFYLCSATCIEMPTMVPCSVTGSRDAAVSVALSPAGGGFGQAESVALLPRREHNIAGLQVAWTRRCGEFVRHSNLRAVFQNLLSDSGPPPPPASLSTSPPENRCCPLTNVKSTQMCG